jgi:hypothetical protein
LVKAKPAGRHSLLERRGVGVAAAKILRAGLAVPLSVCLVPTAAIAQEGDTHAIAQESETQSDMAATTSLEETSAHSSSKSETASNEGAGRFQRSSESSSTCDEGAVEGDASTVEGDAGASGEGAAGTGEGVVEEGNALSATAEAIDLSALIVEQETSSSTVIVLTEGGTYCLTSDVTTSKRLEIKAPDADVTIDLSSFSLTFDTPRQEMSTLAQGLVVRAAKSVSVTGSFDELKSDQIILTSSSKTQGLGSAVTAVAAGCEVSIGNVGIHVSGVDEGTQLRTLNAEGVRATKGSLELDQVAVTVDMSNQTEVNNTVNAMKGAPVGVYVGASVKTARLNGSTIVVHGTPNVAVDNLSRDLQPGSATGVYSLMKDAALEVSATSLDVDAPIGLATGINAVKMTLSEGAVSDVSEATGEREGGDLGGATGEDSAASEEANLSSTTATSDDGNPNKEANLSATTGISVNVNAKQRAIAIQAGGGVSSATLNCELAVTYKGESTPSVSCALYSPTEGAFVLGKAFDGVALGVIVGAFDGSQNADGAYFASFSDEVAAGDRNRFASMFVNGLSSGAPCAVDADEQGLFFRFDAASARAIVETSEGETLYCSSAQEALDKATPGSTVRLMANSDAVEFAVDAQKGDEFALDLCGHVLAGLSVSSRGTLCVKDSLGTGSIVDTVVVGDEGSLVLNSVEVMAINHAQAATGVRVGSHARFEAHGCSISASSSTSQVRAIAAESAGDATIVLDGCSVSAVTYAGSEAAFGIISRAEQGTLKMYGCTMAVRSMSGTCGGIDAVTGVEVSSTRIDVTTACDAQSAWGIKLSGSGASGHVMESAINVLSDDASLAGEYWCLQAGSALNPSNEVAWTFDGVCSFASAKNTVLSLSGAPVVLGAGFAAESGSIYLRDSGLTDNIIATARDGAQDLAGAAGSFAPIAGDVREGWLVAASETGSSLRWTRAAAVSNLTRGESYSSLTEAIAASVSGDRLVLLADCTEAAMEIDCGVEVDLAGHVLTLAAYDDASRENAGAALVYNGQGTLVFRDSSAEQSGAVRALVGAHHEASASAATYVGFSIAAGGTLVFDRCKVEVGYAGYGEACELSLIGVAVDNGSLSLVNGTTLHTLLCGTTQALKMTGIEIAQTEVASTEAPSVSISADSACVVDNSAPLALMGAVASVALTSTNTAVANRNANLVRFYPEEGSDLYEEIQEKFRAQAKYDGTYPANVADTDDVVYGSRVYYAAQLALDNGLLVWAYSDPVSEDEVGPLENVVATSFFTSSKYNLVPTACAIHASSSFEGSLIVEGKVASTCDAGDATGIDAPAKARCEIDATAQVLVQAGDKPVYRLGGLFDLRDHIALGGEVNEIVQYPENDKEHLVTYEYPSARALSEEMGQTGSAANVDPTATISERAGGSEPAALTELPDFASAEVAVTLSGVRTSSGELGADVSATVGRDDSLGSIVSMISDTPDYTEGSLRFHFVGWRVRGASSTLVYSAQAIANGGVVASALPGSSDGEVTLDACYVAAGARAGVITFLVDSYAYSYAAQIGATPSFSLVQAGKGVETPAKVDIEENTNYAFSGWAAASGTVYRGSLPAVAGDAIYTANFDSTPASLSLTFSYWGQADNKLVRKTTTVAVPNGSDPSAVAAQLMEDVGSFVVDGDRGYRFVGWTARGCDDEALFGLQLPTVEAADTYYAVYESTSLRYSVSFIVGDVVHAVAESVSPLLTIDQVMTQLGIESPQGTDGATFRGWGVSPDATSIVRTGLRTVYDLTEAGATTLSLYALFNTPTPSDNPDASKDEGGSGDDSSKTHVEPAVDDDDEANIIITPAITRQDAPDAVVVSESGSSSNAGALARSSSGSSGASAVTGAVGSAAIAPSSTDGVASVREAVESDISTGAATESSDPANAFAFASAVLAALLAAAAATRRALRNGALDRASDEGDKSAPASTKNIEF